MMFTQLTIWTILTTLLVTAQSNIFGPPATGGPYEFCSLRYHSAILINGSMYLYGGEVQTENKTASVSFANNTFWVQDFSQSFNLSDFLPMQTINALPSIPTFPPRRVDGIALWADADDGTMNVYGGEKQNFGQIDSTRIPANEIYSYDISTKTWSIRATTGTLEGRSCGASQEDRINKVGYYLGGLHSYIDDPGVAAGRTHTATGLVQVNLKNNTISTLTTVGLDDSATNVGGSLSYINTVGEQGILVSFGGISVPVGTAWDWFTLAPVAANYVDMSIVSVFDIASQTWFLQKTSGTAPPSRAQFCTIKVSALDNSSHQIYMFGGYNDQYNYAEVYVLTIPSFQWVIAQNVENVARFVHTCLIVGEKNMIVAGGTLVANGATAPIPNVTYCAPDLMFQNFDLNLHTWSSEFNATPVSYFVHPDLVSLIGGGPTGGATVTAPLSGFTNTILAYVFAATQATASTIVIGSSSTSSTSNTSTSGTPSSPPSTSASKKSSHAGAIAGGVIGGLLGLALIAGALLFWLRRRRHGQGPFEDAPMPPRAEFFNSAQPPKEKPEMDGSSPPLRVELPEQAYASPAELDGQTPVNHSLV